jgi:hypothetical protein
VTTRNCRTLTSGMRGSDGNGRDELCHDSRPFARRVEPHARTAKTP